MARPERVLVFGRSGWLGHALWARLQARGMEALGPSRAEADVRDAARVDAAVEAFRPDLVVNLAATNPGAREETFHAVNAEGARHVAAACARRGLRLVHVSTDALLDGRHAPYADDAPPRPLTAYGRSKAAGERAVLETLPGALCVRTSLLWDPDVMDRGTAGFAERLGAGAPCRLFTDEIRCPLDRATLARALLDLAVLPVAGTLNVAGREALSRHAFAVALLEHFVVPGRERVERARAADLEAAGGPPRPRDLTLIVERAEAVLGYPLRAVREVLADA
jgi:dTDP-4-dehydrorhamnose reductase